MLIRSMIAGAVMLALSALAGSAVHADGPDTVTFYHGWGAPQMYYDQPVQTQMHRSAVGVYVAQGNALPSPLWSAGGINLNVLFRR